MSAHTLGSAIIEANIAGGAKIAVFPVTLSASYDTNGSNLDLSGTFTNVVGVRACGHANGTTTNTKWHIVPILGTSGTGTTVKLKVLDLSAAADAEVSAATDLSALVVNLEVIGH